MALVRWEPDDFGIVGLLGGMLDDADTRSARDQLDANYQHGGGWRPFGQWKMLDGEKIEYIDPNPDPADGPPDPPYNVVARAQLRDERINLYEHGWVAIIQPNGDYEVARMD